MSKHLNDVFLLMLQHIQTDSNDQIVYYFIFYYLEGIKREKLL